MLLATFTMIGFSLSTKFTLSTILNCTNLAESYIGSTVPTTLNFNLYVFKVFTLKNKSF